MCAKRRSSFEKCVAEHLGDRKITTVGQLKALDLDDIAYLKKLTGYPPRIAFDMAARWKGMAEEALAFWK